MFRCNARLALPRAASSSPAASGSRFASIARTLVVEDGIGADRRTRRFHRAAGKLKRLVVIGHTGYVTLDALRWLYDVDAALIHIDADGRLLTTSTVAGPSVPTLRRAQAMAPATSAGVEAARDLLRAKVAGQASLLPSLPDGEDVAPEVERGLADIEEAQDISGLLAGELRAAGAYWRAWEALPVNVAPRRGQRRDSVPEHWRTFGARASLLTGGPRSATNPANALLNYLYTLLSAEAAFACNAVGLDPGLGIFHMDRDHTADRAALAFDVMEACRPAVDAYVLALITERTLSAEQLGETRGGSCRLASTLAAELAGTLPVWREQVAPHTERVAHTLQAAAGGELAPMATPLTHANLIAALDKRTPGPKRRRAPAERQSRAPASTVAHRSPDAAVTAAHAHGSAPQKSGPPPGAGLHGCSMTCARAKAGQASPSARAASR